jgi:hypothetical protein
VVGFTAGSRGEVPRENKTRDKRTTTTTITLAISNYIPLSPVI